LNICLDIVYVGSILWFDPRREHSSAPTAKSRSRRAQGLSRLAASSRPPEGLGLDWPEHGGRLKRIGLEVAAICARTAHVGHSRPCQSPHPRQPIRGSTLASGMLARRSPSNMKIHMKIQTAGFKRNSRRW
jgi:hypothetical protein